jgi:hypothetical protein
MTEPERRLMVELLALRRAAADWKDGSRTYDAENVHHGAIAFHLRRLDAMDCPERWPDPVPLHVHQAE